MSNQLGNMVRIRSICPGIPRIVGSCIKNRWRELKIVVYSLFYNDFLNWGYVCDIMLEPICWFVENFTAVLGPILVVMVTILTAIIVCIAYYIGLPYWWEKSPASTVVLLIIGNWLLMNVCFNYYMGVNVPAGYPPQGGLIPEAVSICKKCIKPKPPRTHHCSICNRCVLKMDHHCPWLNNCVGHDNHRYFFQYMAFTVTGIIFIIIFGLEIAYQEFFSDQEPDLVGHPVRINNSEIIPMAESMDHLNAAELAAISQRADEIKYKEWRRRMIIFAGLICVATLAALGGLCWWHAGLITRGETSIEARINSTESARYRALNRHYHNPYDFGPRRNWIIFLGLENRNWNCIAFPSCHSPQSNGLTWDTANHHDSTYNPNSIIS